MATSADVPKKFDVVINGQGYMLDNTYDESPYRNPPAIYSYTNTFVERQNVGSGWGDDQQDFFLTLVQHDWSGGEGQYWWKQSDTSTQNKYLLGQRVDNTIPGQLGVRPTCAYAIGVLANPRTTADSYGSVTPPSIATTTNIIITPAGVRTDKGAHGLGTAPVGHCSAPGAIYVSSEAGGTVGVRRLDAAAFTYTTFNATGASALAYMSNLLYGVRATANFDLISYPTGGGAVTSIFTWKGADGVAALPGSLKKLVAIGSKDLYIVFDNEVWHYDGTNTNKVVQFPVNFKAVDAIQSEGVLYIIGTTGDTTWPGQLRFYDGGQTGIQALLGFIPKAGIAPWRSGIVMLDTQTFTRAYYYNILTGSVTTVDRADGGITGLFSDQSGIYGYNGTGASSDFVNMFFSPSAPTTVTGLSATSSWFDFESSLQKYFAEVQVVFDNPDNATINLTVTTDAGSTQTFSGISSGTIYAPALTARAIKYTIEAHTGTLTNIAIKRVFLRAAPILKSYRTCQYLLDLTGNKTVDPPSYIIRADGQPHNKDGDDMRGDLVTAIQAGIISITDRFGTFTGIIEPGTTEFKEVRSDNGRAEYRALVNVREV